MPRSLPACSAPCWTTSQNASPPEPWVMTAKLRSPPPLPPPPEPLSEPPLSESPPVVHATARKRGAARASAHRRLGPAMESSCARGRSTAPAGSSTKDHAWRAAPPWPDPRASHRNGDLAGRSRLVGVEILSSDHEQVVFCRDAESGLKAIIAVHSTALGPALGGTRFYPYADEDAAVADAL